MLEQINKDVFSQIKEKKFKSLAVNLPPDDSLG